MHIREGLAEVLKTIEERARSAPKHQDETPLFTKRTANDWIAHLKSLSDGELIRGQKTMDVLKSHQNVIVKIRDTWDSDKGWFFRGGFGCGKTRFMNLISKFTPILINDSKEVQSNVEQSGYILRGYTGELGLGCIEGLDVILCLDDFGREEEKTQLWVNGVLKKIYIGSEIIYGRYKTKRKMHIISNWDDRYLTDKYGAEIVSRMNEMFHIVEFPNIDFRKK